MLQQKVLDYFADNVKKLPEKKRQEILYALENCPQKLVDIFQKNILLHLYLITRLVSGVQIECEPGPRGTAWEIVEYLKKVFIVETADVNFSC